MMARVLLKPTRLQMMTSKKGALSSALQKGLIVIMVSVTTKMTL